MLTSRWRRFQLLIGLDYFGDMTIAVTNVLLLQQRGLSGSDIFLLIAAVWLLEALLEVPTGIFADVVGRRIAVSISFATRGVGYGALFVFHSPVIAVIGVLTGAIGGPFASGAIEAWAIDDLAIGDDAARLNRFFSLAKASESTGLFLGLLAGAGLGQLFTVAAPQALAGGACLAGLLVVGGLATVGGRQSPADSPPTGVVVDADAAGVFDAVPEPKPGVGGQLSSGYAETVAGLQLALRNRTVIAVLLLSLGLFVCRAAPGAQWTVHFAGITGGSLIALAVARGLGDALQVPLLLRTARLREGSPVRRGENTALFAVLAGISLLVSAVVSNGYVGLALFTVWGLAWGLCMPGLKAALNEQLDGASRATVLSFGTLLNSLGTGAILIGISLSGVALGHVSGTWVLSGIVAAMVGVAAGVVSWRSARTVAPTIPSNEIAAEPGRVLTRDGDEQGLGDVGLATGPGDGGDADNTRPLCLGRWLAVLPHVVSDTDSTAGVGNDLGPPGAETVALARGHHVIGECEAGAEALRHPGVGVIVVGIEAAPGNEEPNFSAVGDQTRRLHHGAVGNLSQDQGRVSSARELHTRSGERQLAGPDLERAVRKARVVMATLPHQVTLPARGPVNGGVDRLPSGRVPAGRQLRGGERAGRRGRHRPVHAVRGASLGRGEEHEIPAVARHHVGGPQVVQAGRGGLVGVADLGESFGQRRSPEDRQDAVAASGRVDVIRRPELRETRICGGLLTDRRECRRRRLRRRDRRKQPGQRSQACHRYPNP
jgi:Major Facilitator Superfamily